MNNPHLISIILRSASMKSLILLMASLFILCISPIESIQAKPIPSVPVTVAGSTIQASAMNWGGTLHVQLVPLVKAMGYRMNYDHTLGIIQLSKPHRNLHMQLNYAEIALNGLTFPTQGASIYKGSTYVPLRIFADLSGYRISIDDQGHYLLTDRHDNDLTLSAGQPLNASTSKYDIRIPTLVLSDGRNTATIQSINQQLKQQLQSKLAQAKNDLTRAWDQQIQAGNIPGVPYDYELQWHIASNTDNILSLYADVSQYSGGKYITPLRYSWTFDLTTGNQLTLQQLLAKNPNYLTLIKQKMNLQIANGTVIYPFTEPLPDITKSTDWFVRDHQLVIYLSEEKYTSQIHTILEFTIPLHELLPAS